MITHCIQCRRALSCRGPSPLCDSCGGELVAECEAGFALANDAPKPKPAQFTSAGTTQRKLLDGLDCLPGQGDLF